MKRHRPEVKSVLSDPLGCLGISMAIYAGLWTLFCEKTELASWIGFAGCTTYFACGKKKLQGIGSALAVNVSGVCWAMLSIGLGNVWGWPGESAVLCAFISFMIIIQAKIKILSFIPGAYIGCFTTFAAQGDWKMILPLLFLGAVMGCVTDLTGEGLQKIFSRILTFRRKKC